MATTYTPTEIKTRLNTWLRDAEDRTFTSAEKDEIYISALRDPYVYKIAKDASLTTSSTSYTYAIPSGFSDSLVSVGYDDGTGAPYWISHDLWSVIDGNIEIDHGIRLPDSKAMTIVGKSKIGDADSVPEYLVEYILHLCMVEAFELLKTSLTTRFLKNDISMSEIIASTNTHQRKALELRSQLPNRQQIAW